MDSAAIAGGHRLGRKAKISHSRSRQQVRKSVHRPCFPYRNPGAENAVSRPESKCLLRALNGQFEEGMSGPLHNSQSSSSDGRYQRIRRVLHRQTAASWDKPACPERSRGANTSPICQEIILPDRKHPIGRIPGRTPSQLLSRYSPALTEK